MKMKKLRIAIDLTATPKNKTGIGRYMLNLVNGLQAVDRDHEYVLFIHRDDVDGFDIHAPNFRVVTVDSRILRKTYLRIVWEQLVLPFRLRKERIDVLHSPNFSIPYLGRLIWPTLHRVVTFHDMTYFFLPEFHVGWKREFFKNYIRLSARLADQILTISENSRKDIPQYCHPRNPEIQVTLLGVDQRFFTSAPAGRSLLQHYGIGDKPYILYIGTLEPRKNVPGLIAAFEALPKDLRNQYQLVLCGKKGWLYNEIFTSLAYRPDLQNQLVFTGFVEDNHLPSLIRSAAVFAYVSTYEGFGIPVIEGMASGVPTLTSLGSSLQEIAGEGALTVDPNRVDAISRGLAQLLTDKRFAEELAVKGIRQAAKFTWENCARDTVAGYVQAMAFRRKRPE